MVRAGRDVAVNVLLLAVLGRVPRYDIFHGLVFVVPELDLSYHVPEAAHLLDGKRFQLE